jgi:hypothetical protein
LQEPIHGSQAARHGEGKHEPRAALFERVADEHGGDREKAKGCEFVHAAETRRRSSMHCTARASGIVVSSGASTWNRMNLTRRTSRHTARMASIWRRIRRMLSLTPAERLDVLQDFIDCRSGGACPESPGLEPRRFSWSSTVIRWNSSSSEVSPRCSKACLLILSILDIVHSREPHNITRLLAALASLGATAATLPGSLLTTRFGPLDILGTIGRYTS